MHQFANFTATEPRLASPDLPKHLFIASLDEERPRVQIHIEAPGAIHVSGDELSFVQSMFIVEVHGNLSREAAMGVVSETFAGHPPFSSASELNATPGQWAWRGSLSENVSLATFGLVSHGWTHVRRWSGEPSVGYYTWKKGNITAQVGSEVVEPGWNFGVDATGRAWYYMGEATDLEAAGRNVARIAPDVTWSGVHLGTYKRCV